MSRTGQSLIIVYAILIAFSLSLMVMGFLDWISDGWLIDQFIGEPL